MGRSNLSLLIAVAALVAVAWLKLLPALFVGLLVFCLSRLLSERLAARMPVERAKAWGAAAVSFGVVAVMSLAGFYLYGVFSGEGASQIPARMAEALDGIRGSLPDGVAESLPAGVMEIKEMASDWLKHHAGEIGGMGREWLSTLARCLVAMVAAALGAAELWRGHESGGLAAEMAKRGAKFAESFEKVVFSQVKISAINTVFTGIFLLIALPAAGIHIPYAKTLVCITFLSGLLPVVGNLISNTVITAMALLVSLKAAMAALVFLVVIHKLEYFINARIIGSRINSRPWEMLTAMLLCEAAMGPPGVLLAPVAYAWLKSEFEERKLL